MARYLKQDCVEGYIDDNAEIEYAQFCNFRHTILGCMMGDFDTQGRYHVAPAIVDELIRMPKYLVDAMDNIEVCASELKLDKQLTFLVTFESDHVTLSLMEKISFEGNIKLNSGSYSNINEYVLDSIETSGVVNKNAIYSMWNIKEHGGTSLDVFNMDEQTIAAYFHIVNRFKYLMVANTILLEKQDKLEELESGYANRMLEILKAYPKLKSKVENELKSTLEEKKDFIKVDKPNFAKTINEIIEKAIENNIDVLNDKEKESFKQEKHQAQMETNILRREVVDLEVKPAETSQEIDKLNIVDTPFEEVKPAGQEVSIVHTTPVMETQGRDTGAMSEIVAALAQARENASIVDQNPRAVAKTDGTLDKSENPVRENADNRERDALLTVIGGMVDLDMLKSERQQPRFETPRESNVETPREFVAERPAAAPRTEAPRVAEPARSAVSAATAARAETPIAAAPAAPRVEAGEERPLTANNTNLSDYIFDYDTPSGAGSGGNSGGSVTGVETPAPAAPAEPRTDSLAAVPGTTGADSAPVEETPTKDSETLDNGETNRVISNMVCSDGGFNLPLGVYVPDDNVSSEFVSDDVDNPLTQEELSLGGK